MRPLLRTWILLPIVAIILVAGMFWARNQAREDKKDPLTKAQEWVEKSFGMTVEKQTSTGDGLKVEAVLAGAAAAQAGVKAGDRIVALGDRSVWHIYQMVELIAGSARTPVLPLLIASGDDYHLARLSLAGVKTPPPIKEDESGHHH